MKIKEQAISPFRLIQSTGIPYRAVDDAGRGVGCVHLMIAACVDLHAPDCA